MRAPPQAALVLVVAGLAGLAGGALGVQMIHGPGGHAGGTGRPGPSGPPGPSGLPGTTGVRGPHGVHMAMLLNDGQAAIAYSSAVEVDCAAGAPEGCTQAISAAQSNLAAMQNLLVADRAAVPSGESSRETTLIHLLAAAIGEIGKDGSYAVELVQLRSDLPPGAFCDEFDCHAPPWFSDYVAQFQGWYEDAQAYAGP